MNYSIGFHPTITPKACVRSGELEKGTNDRSDLNLIRYLAFDQEAQWKKGKVNCSSPT